MMKVNWEEDFLTAKKFISKGLVNAAIDIIHSLDARTHEQPDKDKVGELYDEQGKIYLHKMANYKEAVNYFTKAMETTNSKDARVKYTIHLGYAYRKMSEFDVCHRYLTDLVGDLDGVSDQTKGILFANLSAIQGINGFYDHVITNIDRSSAFLGSSNARNEFALNNNKGLAYLEIGVLDKAEFHLKKSLQLGGEDYIEPLSELGRLCLLQGKIVESIEYAKRALSLTWSSIINSNKEEIARLCNLLAQIAIRMNERDLAKRLGEKAQVLFGQLGMWRQWQNMESQLEEWVNDTPEQYTGGDFQTVSFKEIRHFLHCLEAWHAQELIHKNVSRLLDHRGYYVQLFARALNLPDQAQADLVLASRFADYGLTALEHEVVMDPRRSEVAFQQYKQHPLLSVNMAKTLNLTDGITEIIEDHHEYYDGSGYPNGKKGNEINGLARILSIIDRYSTGIVLEKKSHFEAKNEIFHGTGTFFDPEYVRVFNEMHDI